MGKVVHLIPLLDEPFRFRGIFLPFFIACPFRGIRSILIGHGDIDNRCLSANGVCNDEIRSFLTTRRYAYFVLGDGAGRRQHWGDHVSDLSQDVIVSIRYCGALRI